MKHAPLLSSGLLLTTLVSAGHAYADDPAPPPPAPPLLLEPLPQPPPPTVVPSAPRPPTVRVHLTVSRPVTLEILSPEETRWHPVCAAPCDAEVPLEGVYRVVDHGMLPSGPLEIEARPGDLVVLDVSVRTYNQFRAGERLTIASYVLGAVGLGLEIGALAVDSTSDAQPVLLWTGVGAAVAAISCTISAYILREPTSLSQSSASPPSGTGARATSPWTRAPVWRDPAGGDVIAPTATSLSLFSTRF
jgi:hypothetical protein